MKRILFLQFLVVLVLFGVTREAQAQAWAGKGRAEGMVVNQPGEPVEGATVKLWQGSDESNGPEIITTNKKGRWSFLGLNGGIWNVLIEAKGYLPSQGIVQVNPFAAAPALRIVLELSPTASIDTGDELAAAGDYTGARAEYEKAYVALEGDAKARIRARIAETYVTEGNYDAARAEYAKVIPVLAPEEQAHVRLQVGNMYQAEKRYAEARQEYEKSLPLLSPEGQAQVLMSIAQGYGLEDNTAAAIETLIKADEVAPGNPQVIQLLADLLMREGRDEEAAVYMAKLPEDAELPSDMVLNMGIRLYNEGNTEEALGFFERAAEEHPEEPEVFYYRGLVYLSQGRNDEATADFHRLLEIDPDSAHKSEVEEFLKFLEQGG